MIPEQSNAINLYGRSLHEIHFPFHVFVSVYTRPDPFGTGTKLVQISFVFTRGLMDPVRIGSAIWYQLGPLMKATPYGTVPFCFEPVPCKQSGPYHTGSDPKRI